MSPVEIKGSIILKYYSLGKASLCFPFLWFIRRQMRHLELRTRTRFSDKTPCSFTLSLLTLNVISVLSHLRRKCISFPIKVGAQKSVQQPKVNMDGKVNRVLCAQETQGRQQIRAHGGPSLSLADICLLCTSHLQGSRPVHYSFCLWHAQHTLSNARTDGWTQGCKSSLPCCKMHLKITFSQASPQAF